MRRRPARIATAIGLLCTGSGALDVPACGWENDPRCPGFHLGQFMVGVSGKHECPEGSTVVTDSVKCKMAAALTSFPWTDDLVEEGMECHFCPGCTPPQFRLNHRHGGAAKWVCEKVGAVPPPPRPPPPPPPRVEAQVPPPGRPPTPLPPAPTSNEWPGCLEKDIVVRHAGQALFTNLQGFGAIQGCFLDDCLNSDKFVAGAMESCAKVCHSLPECKWWVWGKEEGEQKCWFRMGDDGREVGQGWITGSKKCVPPGTEVLIMGNSDCWMENFGYDTCCDPKYGPNGNAQCWDANFNYDRCCFPKEEL